MLPSPTRPSRRPCRPRPLRRPSRMPLCPTPTAPSAWGRWERTGRRAHCDLPRRDREALLLSDARRDARGGPAGAQRPAMPRPHRLRHVHHPRGGRPRPEQGRMMILIRECYGALPSGRHLHTQRSGRRAVILVGGPSPKDILAGLRLPDLRSWKP